MAKKIHFWKKNGGKRLAACGLEGVERLTRNINEADCKNCLRAAEDGVLSVDIPLVAAGTPLHEGSLLDKLTEEAPPKGPPIRDEAMAPTGSWVERDETSS